MMWSIRIWKIRSRPKFIRLVHYCRARIRCRICIRHRATRYVKLCGCSKMMASFNRRKAEDQSWSIAKNMSSRCQVSSVMPNWLSSFTCRQEPWCWPIILPHFRPSPLKMLIRMLKSSRCVCWSECVTWKKSRISLISIIWIQESCRRFRSRWQGIRCMRISKDKLAWKLLMPQKRLRLKRQLKKIVVI